MQFSMRYVLPALALLAPALASNVLDLDPSTFDAAIFNGKPHLVEFFAPWCGHCKKLAPTWEELADTLVSSKDKVGIAKVDCDAHQTIGTKYGISGFPTIKFFDGKSKDPQPYEGGRDLESLQNFITEQTGAKPKRAAKAPSSVKMLTDKTFDSAIGGDQGVLVAFTAPWCGHCKTLAPIWESLANDFVGDSSLVTIAKVDAEANTAVGTAQGIKSYPTIKYFPAGSKTPIDFEGGRSLADFVTYVNKAVGTHRLPGGGLDLTAGTIAALDSLVKGVSGQDLDSVITSVTQAAADLKDTSAQYYIKVLEKIKSNTGYVEKETGRLEGLLKKGGLAPSKADDLTRRLNVLKKFALGEASLEDVKQEL